MTAKTGHSSGDLFLRDTDNDILRNELLRMELKRREMKARRRHSRPGSMPVARLRQEIFPDGYPQGAISERAKIHLFQNA